MAAAGAHAEPAPREETRGRMSVAILASLLVPGLGHLLAGRRRQALLFFLLAELTFLAGMELAGYSQLDYGRWLQPGGLKVLFFLLPELGNVLATQAAAFLGHSAEAGGRFPEYLPWRHLGYTLTGASGVLSCFVAAHAAGAVLTRLEPDRQGARTGPGTAALASLLLPGLGHWLTGRRIKAWWFGGSILGLFFLGMALGDFADFDRQRHAWYWAAQMMLGPVGWATGLATAPRFFTRVLPWQDAGLLFTSAAGLFAVVAALDAWRRAEADWLTREPRGKGKEGTP